MGRVWAIKQAPPFGLDDAVLKSTLYLGKGFFLFFNRGCFFSQTPVRVALFLTQLLVQVLLSLTEAARMRGLGSEFPRHVMMFTPRVFNIRYSLAG